MRETQNAFNFPDDLIESNILRINMVLRLEYSESKFLFAFR